MFDERPPDVFLETQELNQMLRKDVVRPDEKPRAGTHFIHVVPGLRNSAEIAVSDEAKLVVVIKDKAAMSRQAKVLV